MQFKIASERSTSVTRPAAGLTRLPAGLKVQTRVKAGPTCTKQCAPARS
jgi:hypothetical protein